MITMASFMDGRLCGQVIGCTAIFVFLLGPNARITPTNISQPHSAFAQDSLSIAAPGNTTIQDNT